MDMLFDNHLKTSVTAIVIFLEAHSGFVKASFDQPVMLLWIEKFCTLGDVVFCFFVEQLTY
ncbi:MAG: hypothetical protein K6E27_04165 [Eubacterium sp.]|nr:hypothetical protein [Eubacterium sp.]